MATVTLHIRIAKDQYARAGWRVDAALKPRAGALRDSQGEDLWTVRTTMRLNLPDEMLKAPVAQVEVELTPEDLRRIEPEVLEPDEPEDGREDIETTLQRTVD